MNQKALKTLEYTKIIAQLESHAASPLGKALCRDLVPSSDLEEVRTWQAQTTDAADRVRLKGTVSFSGLRDIGSSLKRLEIGSALFLQLPPVQKPTAVRTSRKTPLHHVFQVSSHRNRQQPRNMCLTP